MTIAALAPVALGFFGLGTGYMIYGPYEFFGIPKEKSEALNHSLGQWGIWMPGFLQFVTGTYLWLGLTLFPSFLPSTGSSEPLYMAALAFTAFGVHWFALGYNKYKGADARVDGFMAIAFMWICITGAFTFFWVPAGATGPIDWPVAVLFVLLFFVYLADFPASLYSSQKWTRIKGFWHIVTGIWLMYLMFAAVTTLALGITTLPV